MFVCILSKSGKPFNFKTFHINIFLRNQVFVETLFISHSYDTKQNKVYHNVCIYIYVFVYITLYTGMHQIMYVYIHMRIT